jgi:hypothetical protein
VRRAAVLVRIVDERNILDQKAAALLALQTAKTLAHIRAFKASHLKTGRWNVKDHDNIIKQIRLAEATMSESIKKTKHAVKVAGKANRNSNKHVKSHKNLDRQSGNADSKRERDNKSGLNNCRALAQRRFRKRKYDLSKWFKKNNDKCMKHQHKKFKSHICDSWVNLRKVRAISLKR